MKRLTLILISLIFTWNCHSQTSDTLITIDLKELPDRNGWIFESTGGPAYRLCNGQKCNGEIIDTFENGKIKHKAFYVEGQTDGVVTDYFPNGQIEAIGKCENGSRTGEWLFYFDNGNIQSSIIYEIGRPEPKKWVDYYESGQVESKFEYSDDMYPLYHFDFNQNGDTTFAYYPIEWSTKIYEFYERFDNGQIKEAGQQQYIEDIGWVKIGRWMWFDENGKLTREINYEK